MPVDRPEKDPGIVERSTVAILPESMMSLMLTTSGTGAHESILIHDSGYHIGSLVSY
jgi:hypothetical protein